MLIDLVSAESPVLDPEEFPKRVIVRCALGLYVYHHSRMSAESAQEELVRKPADGAFEYDITPTHGSDRVDYMAPAEFELDPERPTHFPREPRTEVSIHTEVYRAVSESDPKLMWLCHLFVDHGPAVVVSLDSLLP